jgi:hypothetical protein
MNNGGIRSNLFLSIDRNKYIFDFCKSNVIIRASLNGGCSDETMRKRETVGKAAMESNGAFGGRQIAERDGASPGMRADFRQAMA